MAADELTTEIANLLLAELTLGARRVQFLSLVPADLSASAGLPPAESLAVAADQPLAPAVLASAAQGVEQSEVILALSLTKLSAVLDASTESRISVAASLAASVPLFGASLEAVRLTGPSAGEQRAAEAAVHFVGAVLDHTRAYALVRDPLESHDRRATAIADWLRPSPAAALSYAEERYKQAYGRAVSGTPDWSSLGGRAGKRVIAERIAARRTPTPPGSAVARGRTLR